MTATVQIAFALLLGTLGPGDTDPVPEVPPVAPPALPAAAPSAIQEGRRLRRVAEAEKGKSTQIQLENGGFRSIDRSEIGYWEFENSITSAFERVQPHVVQLRIQQHITEGQDGPVVFLTSGFLCSSKGYVVTVGEALQGADRVVARFLSDDPLRPRRADVIGIDREANVGLIHIGPVDLEGLSLASDEEFQPGCVVLAVGSSPGQTPFSAFGMLSARLSDFQIGEVRFKELLQVSVQLQPANAGGVLARPDGSLMGLLLPPARTSEADSDQSMSLALPIAAVRKSVDRLLRQSREGKLTPPSANALPFLGIRCTDIHNEALRKHLSLEGGVLVTGVFQDSPALHAGLQKLDVIVGWNEVKVTSLEHFDRLFHATQPNASVRVQVIQSGKPLAVTIKLGRW